MTNQTMTDVENYLANGVHPNHDLRGVVRHTAEYMGYKVIGLASDMPITAVGVPVPAEEDVIQLANNLAILDIQINSVEEFEIVRAQILPSREFDAYAERAYQFNPFRERHEAREKLDALLLDTIGRSAPVL